MDTANDLALLKVGGQFAPLPIAASRTVNLGGTVATVGFPNIGFRIPQGQLVAAKLCEDGNQMKADGNSPFLYSFSDGRLGRLVFEFSSNGAMLNTMSVKKFIERADLEALLKRLLERDDFKPGSIVESERPDFIITMPDRTIGIETTRSEPEEYFRALNEYPDRWINTTHFQNRAHRRTNDQLFASTGYNGLLQPWKSEETTMLDWLETIRAALSSKREKFNKMDFKKFDENWLLIHNHRPLANDKFAEQLAGQHLNNLFNKVSNLASDFDTVFVHSGVFLFRWQKEELCVA